MPIQLPSWADNPEGRALVQAIIVERPDSRLIRDDWGVRDYPSFAGKTAGKLRRMFSEWQVREFGALDRQFAVSHVWDQARANEVCGAENGNQLIARVLAESEQQERRAA